MDGKHPNRKKDKYNPYVLTIENGLYFIAFADGQGVHHKIEIDQELYAAFNCFELEDISQLNVISRYIEHSELIEGTLNQRAIYQPELIEDSIAKIIDNEHLHMAISKLPEIQRRRVLLYYFEGYTFDQIAKMEGCTKRAVKFSVDIAIKKIKEYF